MRRRCLTSWRGALRCCLSRPALRSGLLLTLLGAPLACTGAEAAAAQSRSIRVTGGGVTLLLGQSPVQAGGEIPPLSNSSTGLSWSTGPGGNRKITVSTTAPGQSFTLAVVAEAVSGTGTPMPPVTLTHGMAPQDLVRSLMSASGNHHGSCTLRYTATAPASAGNSSTHGSDLHTVTFTLLDQ